MVDKSKYSEDFPHVEEPDTATQLELDDIVDQLSGCVGDEEPYLSEDGRAEELDFND